MTTNLHFIGMDEHSRPVYENDLGTLYKDVDPDENTNPQIYSVLDNDFEGEPDIPLKKEVTFIPERITKENKNKFKDFVGNCESCNTPLTKIPEVKSLGFLCEDCLSDKKREIDMY